MKQIRHALIFEPGSAPFASCHASCLCILSDGTRLCAWFGGSREGAPDTAIWLSSCRKGRWEPPRRVAKDSKEAHWNPVLFEVSPGELLMMYKVGDQIAAWHTRVRRSWDGGRNWSEGVPLAPEDRDGWGPVRTKPVRLPGGAILCGASTEQGEWMAYCDRSEDGLRTLERSAPLRIPLPMAEAPGAAAPATPQSVKGRGVIQPALWAEEDGSAHLLLRSSEGRIYRSDSMDGGRTWCAPYDTGLPNNNSGLDVARLPGGAIYLCLNPVGDNWGARTPLTLERSTDGGRSWSRCWVLEDAPGEYSYPSLAWQPGRLCVTYTYRREAIAYCELGL